MKEINRLLEIMKTLRDPEQGCPWDRKQTIQSILPYTLEEVYEIVDVVEKDLPDALCSELGDLLFHIVFYAQIADETGYFNFRQVVENICSKLQNRHPHVFSDVEINDAEEQSLAWEILKHKERRQRNNTSSLLDEINTCQPAMSHALAIQKRVAVVGFDWDGPAAVLEKVDEEIGELRSAIDSAENDENIEDEIGDVLFACVNLARHLDINPETALRKTNRKFENRFKYIEQSIDSRGMDFTDVSLDEMEVLWQEAKQDIG